MDDFIGRLAKAELHLHLEGTVEPETLWELALRHRSQLGAAGRDAISQLYSTSGFSSFLQAFKTICEHLREPEDYETVAYEALRKLAQQNVRYAEITLSVGVILWKREEPAVAFEGVQEACRRAQQDFGIRTQWIFDAVRQFGAEKAMEVARHAARLRDRGVVAFGIGGDERNGPAELFREVFAFAHGEGLRITVHAGETAGPESIWSALRTLRADRIGHGLTAIQDPRLVDYLAEHQIPVEICLSSNVRTCCVTDIAQHPLRQYFDRGLAVSLHTDDPALFATDLNREYLLARDVFGFTNDELKRLARNSFEAAFVNADEKQSLLTAVADAE
ncbi:MAG: adenosine deaminase [Acidobacteria bacterium]|nr:adenosine deaminase [Acidobacteriota bacterium]